MGDRQNFEVSVFYLFVLLVIFCIAMLVIEVFAFLLYIFGLL